MVTYRTVNAKIMGSIPNASTINDPSSNGRKRGFDPCNAGSSPAGSSKDKKYPN